MKKIAKKKSLIIALGSLLFLSSNPVLSAENQEKIKNIELNLNNLQQKVENNRDKIETLNSKTENILKIIHQLETLSAENQEKIKNIELNLNNLQQKVENNRDKIETLDSKISQYIQLQKIINQQLNEINKLIGLLSILYLITIILGLIVIYLKWRLRK